MVITNTPRQKLEMKPLPFKFLSKLVFLQHPGGRDPHF